MSLLSIHMQFSTSRKIRQTEYEIIQLSNKLTSVRDEIQSYTDMIGNIESVFASVTSFASNSIAFKYQNAKNNASSVFQQLLPACFDGKGNDVQDKADLGNALKSMGISGIKLDEANAEEILDKGLQKALEDYISNAAANYQADCTSISMAGQAGNSLLNMANQAKLDELQKLEESIMSQKEAKELRLKTYEEQYKPYSEKSEKDAEDVAPKFA